MVVSTLNMQDSLKESRLKKPFSFREQKLPGQEPRDTGAETKQPFEDSFESLPMAVWMPVLRLRLLSVFRCIWSSKAFKDNVCEEKKVKQFSTIWTSSVKKENISRTLFFIGSCLSLDSQVTSLKLILFLSLERVMKVLL